MPVNQEELESMIGLIDKQLNLLVNARDDIRSLIRIDASINDTVIGDRVISDTKVKLIAASQALITLLRG